MPSTSSAHHGLVAMLFIGFSTAIGFWIAVQHTNDLGTVRTWFWVGLGLAGVYLLTVIANSLEQLGTDY